MSYRLEDAVIRQSLDGTCASYQANGYSKKSPHGVFVRAVNGRPTSIVIHTVLAMVEFQLDDLEAIVAFAKQCEQHAQDNAAQKEQ